MFVIKQNGIMCAIMNAAPDLEYRILSFVIFKLFLTLIGTIITLICYILTIIRIRRRQQMLADPQDLRTERLLLYPIILFASFLPVIVDDFLRLCINFDNTIVFQASKMLFTHSIGFTNALIYGYQRKVYFEPVTTESESKEANSSERSQRMNWSAIERNWKEMSK